MEHSSIACGLSLLRGASLVGTTLMSGLNRMPCGHLIRQPRASAILHGWHIGSGIWVTVVVHVSDREVEDSGARLSESLEARRLQNAYKTAFLPICGVSFRFADFDRISNKYGGKLVNFAYLSKEVKPGVWTDAYSWHSLFEVSPLDFQSYAARAVVIPSSQLSLPLKVGVKKGRDDDMEDDEQTQEAEVQPLESAPPPESPAPLPKRCYVDSRV